MNRRTHQFITLSHGNGGRRMRELIDDVFREHLHNPFLDTNTDAACLTSLSIDNEEELVITSDSFTVQPLEFPGGNIGSLAIHGIVNDLAVSGAIPLYATLNVIIEEGLEISVLQHMIKSLGQAAREAHVSVVCGDTKVVPRGEGSELYLSLTGIGKKSKQLNLNLKNINTGDKVIVSGPVGDHGAAILLARGGFGLRGDIQSDSGNITAITQSLIKVPGLKFMRDPTRGGLATVAHEISQATGYGVQLYENEIPIRDNVRAMCEILGFDPLYLACEGRVVAVISATQVEQAISEISNLCPDAKVIGTISDHNNQVVIETAIGGQRLLPELEEEALPRIC